MEEDEKKLSDGKERCSSETEIKISVTQESFSQLVDSKLNVEGNGEKGVVKEKLVASGREEEDFVDKFMSVETVTESGVVAGNVSASEVEAQVFVAVEEAIKVVDTEGGSVVLEKKVNEDSVLAVGSGLEFVVTEIKEECVDCDSKQDASGFDNVAEIATKTVEGLKENVAVSSRIGIGEEQDATSGKIGSVIPIEVLANQDRTELEIFTEGDTDASKRRFHDAESPFLRDEVNKTGEIGILNFDHDVEYTFAENERVDAGASSIFSTELINTKYASVNSARDPAVEESLNTTENWELKERDIILPPPDSNMEMEEKDQVHDMDGDAQFRDAEIQWSGPENVRETKSDAHGTDIDDSHEQLSDNETKTLVSSLSKDEAWSQDTKSETEADTPDFGKSLRGKKRKNVKISRCAQSSHAKSKSSSRHTEEEDVCFICFDGGDLVLCDRRGCPKAYHPSCVNRDDAFFQTKGLWNCGWHLCSICQKNAHFMCYTCTFSLCRSCIKDAVILCVRKNKGFCETCMDTVMLIEKNEQGIKDAQIDFDDKSYWEYLFKDYYIDLKSKLSLSSAEVAEAKNPLKGFDSLSVLVKKRSSEVQIDVMDEGSGSDDCLLNANSIKLKRRLRTKLTKGEPSVSADVTARDKPTDATARKKSSLYDSTEWGSKELLEFVSLMRNGDTSLLSQFDVQALLLDYIKQSKLRDPRRKSQIICDARLQNLFGKPRVGHFEMLKLLESHFAVKDDNLDDAQGNVDIDSTQLEADVASNTLSKTVDKKHKTNRKGSIQSNLDDYAAVDIHNIGLLYLRRKLMEDLLEDEENFPDKVVGTFVRIRISASIQKQDLYRLVQVVGTRKGAVQYKIGKKTTDTMVEILNLDKTEVISIDSISNQDFTEEECNRLRQSIKCGLISRLTVGEILDKILKIKEARVNDWLESENLRLSHLRDRASDLGRRKELRECVEKLELLKTPEERLRRLAEIPKIHSDPKMDPNYDSDENETEATTRASVLSGGSDECRGRRAFMPPASENSVKDSRCSAVRVSRSFRESNRNFSTNKFSLNTLRIGENEMVKGNSWKPERNRNNQEPVKLEIPNSGSNVQSVEQTKSIMSLSESFTSVQSASTQPSLSVRVAENAVKINESEKMWHYQDPSGKVQGPFSVVQLRKWNNTGLFPADLKIWKTAESQDQSMLLVDALDGKFHIELTALHSETNVLLGSRFLSGHSEKTFGTSSHQDGEKEISDHFAGSHSKLNLEKLARNDITSLLSPTPKFGSNVIFGERGSFSNAIQSPAVSGTSPAAVLQNTDIHSSASGYHLNSAVQMNHVVRPIPNLQPDMLRVSAGPLHTLETLISKPRGLQMHDLMPSVSSVNPQGDAWGWVSGLQSGQAKAYPLGESNVQNSASHISNSGTTVMPHSDLWRLGTHVNQINMHLPATLNAPWSMGSIESNLTSVVNPSTGWGAIQANTGIGTGISVPGNMNWESFKQAPPSVNSTSGWGSSYEGSAAPGNISSAWSVTPEVWVPSPAQVTVPGNGRGLVSGSLGAPVQNELNQNAGQFSGHFNQSQVSGLGSDTPWNGQSSFSGSRQFNRKEVICPYNATGRCRKGAHCEYMHH